MASLTGETLELYLRHLGFCPWDSFVRRCLDPLGTTPERFSPRPRDVENAFCASFRWDAGSLTAVSVFADHRALPDEETLRLAWTEGMEPLERTAYETAVAGVRSLGRRRPEGCHAMASWTFEADGAPHRAVSLRLPLHPAGTPG